MVVGHVSFDKYDNGDNEDMLTVDLRTLEVTPYKPSQFESEYPQYAGNHRKHKDYLGKL